MTTTTLPGTEVAAFAAAVRTALADLPPDDLDELTDGLEADLAERAADAGEDLGDPVAYAEELRAAAGYPPRAARSHVGAALPDLRTLPRELRRRWNALRIRNPWVASLASFAVALRPVWWVFRGVAAHTLLASMLGVNGLAWWPVGVGLVVLSVQAGRGRMRERAWVRWLTRAVTAIVLVASPLLLGWAVNAWNNAMYPVYDGEVWYPQSLNVGGTPIDNIFAYDANGDPIEQVQLFDQDGNPLNLIGDTGADFWGAQDGSMLVPSGDVPGRAGWNVYPLAHVNSWSDYEDDGRIDDTEVSETVFPSAHVKPLAGAVAPAEVAQPMTEEATTPAG
ncbi:MAG TPA: hypothetical protein VNR36_08930 [Pseudolysinimonas sp.]|nr:hypothetical protein [Pseudolysinimonas sp.]